MAYQILHNLWIRLRSCILPAALILFVSWFFLSPYLPHSPAKKWQSTCLSHEKQIGISLQLYMNDNDERLPPAHNWMDATAIYIQNVKQRDPYIKDWHGIYQCPAAGESGETNYAFDNRFSLLLLNTIEAPAERVVLFDSTKTNRNATDAGESLPIPGVHGKGNDFLYVDGHVRWLKQLP